MQSWYSSTEKIVQPDWLLRGTFWENGPSFGKWSHFPLKSCLKKKTVALTKEGVILWTWKWLHWGAEKCPARLAPKRNFLGKRSLFWKVEPFSPKIMFEKKKETVALTKEGVILWTWKLFHWGAEKCPARLAQKRTFLRKRSLFWKVEPFSLKSCLEKKWCL